MWALALFGVVVLVQTYFYLFLFRKFSLFEPEAVNDAAPFVSVVICARNEELQLKENLPAILDQDYANYELILVDDNSSDGSKKIMLSFQKDLKAAQANSRTDQGNSQTTKKDITVLSLIGSENKGKKKALAAGIEAARGEVLLLTDADCRPASKNWMRHMVRSMPRANGLVLGYGPYKKQKGSFLNKLIRFETLMTAIQYFAYAINGQAYMGVGRNMAYHKSLYRKVNGFQDHAHVLSGDDDLFVGRAAQHAQVRICVNPESFAYSEPKTDWKSWIGQKQRHITTSAHYRTGHKVMLGLFYLSQLGFYLGAVLLLIQWEQALVVLALVLWRYMLFYGIIFSSARKLREKDLTTLAPLYEFSIIFMQLYIFFKNSVAPPKQW